MKYKFEILFTVLFIFIYCYLGNSILLPMLIEDECYYHDKVAPFYIKLLFDFPSYEGFHPVVSKLGYLIFGFIGFIIGRKLKTYIK